MRIPKEVATLLYGCLPGKVLVLTHSETGDNYLEIDNLRDAMRTVIEDNASKIHSRRIFLQLETD